MHLLCGCRVCRIWILRDSLAGEDLVGLCVYLWCDAIKLTMCECNWCFQSLLKHLSDEVLVVYRGRISWCEVDFARGRGVARCICHGLGCDRNNTSACLREWVNGRRVLDRHTLLHGLNDRHLTVRGARLCQ